MTIPGTDERSWVPLARPDLSGNEKAYVADAIDSTWISSAGAYLARFEREFAEASESKHCLAVCNGTVAVQLALAGLNLKRGDEVLVPSLTYIAVANAVTYLGGTPVFIDVQPDTWCIDPVALEARISTRTRGIVAVHSYGHPADMDAINDVAARHGLWVVEDAAEAPFARYKGRATGSLASIATFSFYGNKVLTSGEGGAVTFSDDGLVRPLSMLRGQGMDPDHRYYFPITGYNFRLTNVAAAILCAQLERAEEMVKARRAIYSRYDAALADTPGISPQVAAPWAEVSPWLYSVLVDEAYGRTRDELASRLTAEGIETRPFFIPLHTLPPFREAAERSGTELPVTDRLASEGLNLPTFAGLPGPMVDRVCDVIGTFAR